MAPTEEASGPLERFEAESHRNYYIWFLMRRWGVFLLHWPLTLQHRYSGLSSDPGGGRILVQVVTSGVVAGPALVGPSIVQHETGNAQHAHAVCAIGRVDGHSPLTGAVPQLPEGIGSVDLSVPPLDLWGGVSHHVTVQLKGVARELSLRERWFHKASWTRWRQWWRRMDDKTQRKANRWRMERQKKKSKSNGNKTSRCKIRMDNKK